MVRLIGRGSALLALLALLSGCQTVDAMTGKDRLQLDLDRARAESRAKIAEMEVQNRTLEKEKGELQAQLDTIKLRYAAAMKELEKLRSERSSAAGRINVLLFRGDIVYAIIPGAYGDYRAGLRLHAVNDPEFGLALAQFEKLEGGDSAILRVLRQLDADDDRIIGREEARSYREQQAGSLKPETK